MKRVKCLTKHSYILWSTNIYTLHRQQTQYLHWHVDTSNNLKK
jgi:hypothetical protein